MRQNGYGAWTLGGIALALLFLVSSCAETVVQPEQEAEAQNSQSQNSQYRTYRWITTSDAKALGLRNPRPEQTSESQVRIIKRPQTEQKVRQVVEQDLKQFDYIPSEGEPDFYITFYSPIPDGRWISSWSGYANSSQGTPIAIYPDFQNSTNMQPQPGTAYLVIYDSKTRRPKWTGTVMDAISSQGQVNASIVTPQIEALIAEFKNTV